MDRLNCFLTGATGFIGSHLARELIERRHQVTALVRPGANLDRLSGCESQLRVIEGSLDDLNHFKSALRGQKFDAAIHLAWSGVTAEHRNDFDQLTGNVTRSLELWKLLQSMGCGTWLSVGSQAEYGLHRGIINENLQPQPVTAYGTAKLALCLLTERLCAMAGMRFVWMRLFSTYGPGDDDRHMVPSVINSLLQGKRYPLTAGEQLWDFLYIGDVVAAMISALETPSANGVFNVASGKPGRLCDFMKMVRDRIDPSLPLAIGELPYRPDQVMHLEGDISRLRAATNWSPQIDWDEGIRRTIEWHKHKESGVYAR